MSEDLTIWSLIAGLCLATYLIRYSFIGLIGDRKLPDGLVEALGFVPVTVLPALVAPAVFTGADGELALEAPQLAGAAMTVGVGMLTRKLLVGLVAGGAVYLLLRWAL